MSIEISFMIFKGQALANFAMDNSRVHSPNNEGCHFGPGDHSLGRKHE